MNEQELIAASEKQWRHKYEALQQMAFIMIGALMAANEDGRFKEVIDTVNDTVFDL